MLLLLAVLTMRVTIAPVAFHTPPVVEDYRQETQRHVARETIEARLLHPAADPGPWRRGADQDRGILIEVTRVTLRTDGATRRYDVTTIVHVPSGQTRTIVGSSSDLEVAARRAADQITAWLAP